MSEALSSLIRSGTKLWLDSVDPEFIRLNRAAGATGATSNPAIVSDLVGSGRFDDEIIRLAGSGYSDHEIAWHMTDYLVTQAEQFFLGVWQRTGGDDGYVSFELDPLIEDPQLGLSDDQRVERYIELGRRWAQGHQNRMIKVPATTAGIRALETLVASGVTVNVTLIFTPRQYVAARDSVWRGAQQRDSLDAFKSVYSIFISRIDVYTEKHCPQLSSAAQGLVGIVNAQRIWQMNRDFWRDKQCPLKQEIVFASTGTKRPEDAPWKYVQALAGSDIQTNPPATNSAVMESDLTFHRTVDQLPPAEVLDEIDRELDIDQMESTLMAEGIEKFVQPQKLLLQTVAQKRAALVSS